MDEYLIESLVRKERFYRDTKQWEKWRSCYDPDASKTLIKISWFTGNIDDWVAGSKKMANVVAPQHAVTPNETIVNGSSGLAITTAQIATRFTMEGADFDICVWLRLVFRAAKVDGEWKLRNLDGIYIQDSIIPAVPREGDHVKFDFSIIENARKSYRSLCWSIARKGGTPRLDLMGIDDEEATQKFMEESYAWIQSPSW